jgi:hypothetical protein
MTLEMEGQKPSLERQPRIPQEPIQGKNLVDLFNSKQSNAQRGRRYHAPFCLSLLESRYEFEALC